MYSFSDFFCHVRLEKDRNYSYTWVRYSKLACVSILCYKVPYHVFSEDVVGKQIFVFILHNVCHIGLWYLVGHPVCGSLCCMHLLSSG